MSVGALRRGAMLFFCLGLFLFSFFACGGGEKRVQEVVVAGDTLKMFHSCLLQIIECDGFTAVNVKNPWGDGSLHRYVLVPKDVPLPVNVPQGTILRTPLDNMLVFSSVHASLLQNFGRLSAVKGVCDAKYMLLPAVHDAVARGEVVDCGSSLNVDSERLVQLSPDAILVLPFENGGYGKLDKLNFPLVECVEYMENSPLAAAEWMRFYGRLVGRAAFADSLFAAVSDSFEKLSSMVDGCASRPALMCELKSSSAWYVPAAQSTMGQMYATAGARYLFDDNEGCGSFPLSFEKVLSRAINADFWLFKYNSPKDKSYSSLAADFAGYSHFKPFKIRNIYACNTAKKAFYEETPFRPDLLLADLIYIFHPSLVAGHKLRYYEKLQE